MIRKFIPADTYACCQLIQDCIEADNTISAALRGKMIHAESPHSMLERSRLFYVTVYESGPEISGPEISGSEISGIAGLDMNEIRLLCVSPEHQRLGIGRALLDHMISMVPEFLFPDIFVYASTESVPFYKSAGFVEKGPMSFTFAGGKLETAFMTRSTR